MKRDAQAAVIGAGPAGITAAVQLHRAGIATLLFESAEAGGVIRAAWRVENFPPFPSGSPGSAIAKRFREHLQSFEIAAIKARVNEIFAENPFRIVTDQGEFTSRCVILACGLCRIPLEVPEEIRPFLWEGYELPEKSSRRVLIVGGGDVAFDQAARWSEAGFETWLVHRNTRPKALPRIIEAAKDSGVRVIQSPIAQWQALSEGVVRKDISDTAVFQYIAPHIGRTPKAPAVSGKAGPVSLNREGRGGETSVKGLFVAGDICRGRMRQVSIAIGDGMQAALAIVEQLQKS